MWVLGYFPGEYQADLKSITIGYNGCMLYERAKGPVKPFHEDEQGYIFRFFCGNSLVPTEQRMPKGGKRGYVCDCGVRISVEDVGNGPCLRFWSRPEAHFAAKERA